MSSFPVSPWAARLRRMGWFTLAFFTVKGLASTALLAWAVLQAMA